MFPSHDPGTATSVGPVTFNTGTSTTNQKFNTVFFNVRKRANPTVTIYSPVTGASGQLRTLDVSGGTPSDVAANIFVPRENGFGVNTSASAAGIYYHWTADTEIV